MSMGCTASGKFPHRAAKLAVMKVLKVEQRGKTLSHSLTGTPSTGFKERYALGVSF